MPPGGRTWELTSDQPVVTVPGQPPVVLANAPAPGANGRRQAARPRRAPLPARRLPAAPGAAQSAPQDAHQGRARQARGSPAPAAAGDARVGAGVSLRRAALALPSPRPQRDPRHRRELVQDLLDQGRADGRHHRAAEVQRARLPDGARHRQPGQRQADRDHQVHQAAELLPGLDLQQPGRQARRAAALPKLNVSDLLVITAPPDVLLFVDQLMDKLLGDLPQIELQVRVVEINLDDLLAWDSKVGINHLEHPNQPFDPVNNPVSGNFGAGFRSSTATAPRRAPRPASARPSAASCRPTRSAAS